MRAIPVLVLLLAAGCTSPVTGLDLAAAPKATSDVVNPTPVVLYGVAAGDHFGSGVSEAGDVNGDGFDDLLVGALGYSSGRGAAYLFPGSRSGIVTAPLTELHGPSASIAFGAVVRGIGDVNADGFDDVAVAASGYDRSRGEVFVYLGSATGLGTAVATLTGPAQGAEFGAFLSGGDVNGDGYADLVVGCPNEPAIHVYFGSASGIVEADGQSVGVVGGGAVTVAGDVNGDGYDDVVATYTAGGTVYLYEGSPSGIGAQPDTISRAGTGSGSSLDGAGDANGDGYLDVVVGVDGQPGLVFLGSASGLPSATSAALSSATGTFVGGGGDLNGDGYDDVIVGDGDTAAALFLGSRSGVSSTSAQDLSGPTGFGEGVDLLGDLNGDGLGDAVVGAPSQDGAMGAVYVYGRYDDADGDGVPSGSDCDDADPTVGAAVVYYRDVDTDGYGDVLSSFTACEPPTDGVADATDCDDTDAAVHPGASEVCDGADQDCDEAIDEDPVDAGSWYTDGDGDGYGDPATGTVACTGPKGTIADGTDCDDASASVHPGADEVCDGLDQDCDDVVDDDPVDGTTLYADADGDGFGDPDVSAVTCELPADYVGDATDCDDADAAVYPGAEEVCDGVDQDCDGAVDPADCEEAAPSDKGCGCATGGDPSASWLAGLLVALVVRRRQVRHADFTSR